MDADERRSASASSHAPPPVISFELRPPTWWKAARTFFVVMGAFELIAGAGIVAILAWPSAARRSLDVAGLVAGLLIASAGLFLLLKARRTRRYGRMPLVLDETHAVLPRLRTNESVRVAYEDIRTVHYMKLRSLRLRVFVRTAQGDFFVHRAWLPSDWTLEALIAELVARRNAARAAKATAATP